MITNYKRLIALSFIMIGILFGLWTPISSAHGNVSVAYSNITVEDGVIKYVLQIDMYDMWAEVAAPEDADISSSALDVLNQFLSSNQGKVETSLLAQIKLYADNLPLKGKLSSLHAIEKKDEAQPFAEAVIEYPIINTPHLFRIDYNLVFDKDQWHVNYLNASIGDLKQDIVIVNQIRELQMGHMNSSYAMKHYFLVGVEHLLTAFEVIIFIIALLLGCKSIKQTLLVMAVFTAAYSFTLILTAQHILVLPDRFVDSVIALSILYMALNTLFNQNMKHQLWLAGGFGLIHGFGFAEVMSGMRSDGGLTMPSLIGFNSGIVAAVILLVLILSPIIYYVRKIQRAVPIVVTAMAVFGVIWFIYKAYL